MVKQVHNNQSWFGQEDDRFRQEGRRSGPRKSVNWEGWSLSISATKLNRNYNKKAQLVQREKEKAQVEPEQSGMEV